MRSRVVEVSQKSRAPLADVDPTARAAFPAVRFATSFVNEGYAIVFGDADLPMRGLYSVQVKSKVPGYTCLPWDTTNIEDARVGMTSG